MTPVVTRSSATNRKRDGRTALLVLILGVAYALRVALAMRGGQMFWISESQRFHPCIAVIDAVRYHHDWGEVADIIVNNFLQNVGYFLFGVPIAWINVHLVPIVGEETAIRIAAAIMALGSIAVLGLVVRAHAPARRVEERGAGGGSPRWRYGDHAVLSAPSAQ